MAVLAGHVNWWPYRQLGFGSLFWIPIFAVSITLEFSAVRRGLPLRPSAAAAVAGFMIGASFGTDVITPYESAAARFTIAAALAVSVQLIPPIPSSSLREAYRVIEPALLVAIGWLAANRVSSDWAPASDLRWLLLFFAVPASAASVIVTFLPKKRSGVAKTA